MSFNLNSLAEMPLGFLIILSSIALIILIGIYIILHQRKLLKKYKKQLDILDRELISSSGKNHSSYTSSRMAPSLTNYQQAKVIDSAKGPTTIFDRFAPTQEEPSTHIHSSPPVQNPSTPQFHQAQAHHWNASSSPSSTPSPQEFTDPQKKAHFQGFSSSSPHSPTFVFHSIKKHPQASHILMLQLMNRGGKGQLMGIKEGKYNESKLSIQGSNGQGNILVDSGQIIGIIIQGKENEMPTYHFKISFVDASNRSQHLELSGWGEEMPIIQEASLHA